ncbi:MAG: M20/M25/M40 family metallo-hydrolase, partial [Gemmatimonadota bacterium]|nr:M20/M25/M40 family metallo-hydrolase [Gemmatimonadota bacterium]
MEPIDRRRFASSSMAALGALAWWNPPLFQARTRVDGARINGHLETLSQYGRNPEGGVSRVAYSDADREARQVVLGWMREAGLDVTVDPAANLVGRRAGRDAGLRPLVIGSHIDSVPRGGNYDGDVGSLAAIEVARTLKEAGTALRHPLEVLIFQNEEGGTIGSHALAAGLTQ